MLFFVQYRHQPLVRVAFPTLDGGHCADRRFLSFTAVAVGAASDFPPDVCDEFTLGIEFSLITVVYHVLGGTPYIRQFRLQSHSLQYRADHQVRLLRS